MPQNSTDVRFSLAAAPTTLGCLEVRFTMSGDRFQHRLVQRTGDTERELVHSVDEGEPSNWPASPPIQQLDDCVLGGGERGLVAVGLAGTSHWSLAIEARGPELWFDVACRTPSGSGVLRSTYRKVGDAQDTVWQPAHDGCECQESGDRLWFAPVVASQTYPATIRWRYGFALKSADSVA